MGPWADSFAVALQSLCHRFAVAVDCPLCSQRGICRGVGVYGYVYVCGFVCVYLLNYLSDVCRNQQTQIT